MSIKLTPEQSQQYLDALREMLIRGTNISINDCCPKGVDMPDLREAMGLVKNRKYDTGSLDLPKLDRCLNR